jgi:hypothetical protein
MRAVIDLVLLAILAYCTWMGYKRGVVNAALGILAIVVALYGGSLLSSAFAGQLIPAFQPFASGIIETKSDKALADMKMGTDLSIEDIVTKDASKKYDYCLYVYEEAGMYEKRAQTMAKEAAELSDKKDINIEDASEQIFCSDILYVGGTVLAAILILIVFGVIANLANLTFHIPNAPKFEVIGGTAAGFLKGFALCVLLCWLLSFCGLMIGKDVLDKSILTRFFLLFGFLTAGIL